MTKDTRARQALKLGKSRRLDIICAQIMPCDTFADIGCDHGYIAKHALDNNLCKKAVICDISQNSLDKAKQLLHKYSLDNRVIAYCTDGFTGVEEKIDTAVIAGMGGLEIISILKNAKTLPNRLILQPMKNTNLLRAFAAQSYKTIKDFLFYDKDKFYDSLVLEKGRESLSELEIEFGRDNLKNLSADFKRYVNLQIKKMHTYIKEASCDNKLEIKKRLDRLESIIKG